MIGFLLGVLVVLGVIFAPFMTIGAIMLHYGHPILGVILIVIGILGIFSDKYFEN